MVLLKENLENMTLRELIAEIARFHGPYPTGIKYGVSGERVLTLLDRKRREEEAKKFKPGERVCLKCSDKFNSAGVHNRICNRCKSSNGWNELGMTKNEGRSRKVRPE